MENLELAHNHCTNHKHELAKDNICGCFYCLEIFCSDEIENWVEDPGGTALCPHCGIDAIIGESSGFAITKEFRVISVLTPLYG